MDEPNQDQPTQRDTTHEQQNRDRTKHRADISGGMHDTVQATGGVVTTVVNATGDVAQEIIHAAGRVGVTLADEVFNVIGSILGGASETVGSVFQGRRPSKRGRTEEAHQSERPEQDSRTGSF